MSEVKNEGLEVLRARIVELEQNLAYFPSTVRSLAETVTEREAEINQLRAELAAPVQQVSVPDVLRELLERIIQFRWIADDLEVKDCRKKLRALLSAPSPAGVDGLEVVLNDY